MSTQDLIELIRSTPHCNLLDPAGLPAPAGDHVLPEDVREFYESAGGAELFIDRDYGAHILPPSLVEPANPVIVGELCEYDISSSWYLIARTTESEYLTIDFKPQRLGKCYDSFFDRHGVAGSCPVIATSFSDLVERLLANAGDHWYWLNEGFISLGDAYD